MESYISALTQMLLSIQDLMVRLALPLVLGGVLVLLVLVFVSQRHPDKTPALLGQTWLTRATGYALVALVTASLWATLRTLVPRARQEIAWRESTEATTNPVPDSPPVVQYAPALAALTERTYTRTLTLPPSFFQRIGTEGLGILSPYLTDPTADSVLQLVDTFRRSGSDVVFTRQVTRLDEEPIPFTASTIRLTFDRLAGRAYDVQFEGHFIFQNSTDKALTARFVFPLPEAGTVRDLNVSVGETPLLEPDDDSTYQWKSTLEPGERKEAVVRYRVAGSQTWQFDLGSRRRRVQAFTLEADTKGPVRFMRGSLHPVQNTRGPLRWELKNVVTAQRIALAFPPDVAGRDGYLQALAALPASLMVFVLGILILDRSPSRKLLAALVLFGLGLSAVPVLANYVGFVGGILLGPLLGAGLVLLVRSRHSLYATLPAALLPAAFLSPQHSGLLVLVLALATLLLVSLKPPKRAREAG